MVCTILAALLAFTFLGARGIWDPDEGRYTNVALNMLHSGNWLEPARNSITSHWTKPPMVYWLIAASIDVFGPSPWAARLPIALSYLAGIVLVRCITKRLHPGSESWACIVYATMALPHLAGQLVTADYPLAAFQMMAMYGYVLSAFGTDGAPARRVGVLVMWLGFALGFLTKGPPALITLVPITLFTALSREGNSVPWRWHLAGVALFLAVSMPWYVIVTSRNEGLLGYFVGAEVIGRIATDRFNRNGEWYGWLAVYAPTLLLGTLPWTWSVLGWVRGVPAAVRCAIHGPGSRAAPQRMDTFLALWFFVPLLIFCLARSRLPLYILPLFAPLAIAVAVHIGRRPKGFPDMRWLLVWTAVLIAFRFGFANLPSKKNSEQWAQEIQSRAAAKVEKVVFVEDEAHFGLHLHLDAEVVRAARHLGATPRFNPPFDIELLDQIRGAEHSSGVFYVAQASAWEDIQNFLSQNGYLATQLGDSYADRVIFKVQRFTRSSVR